MYINLKSRHFGKGKISWTKLFRNTENWLPSSTLTRTLFNTPTFNTECLLICDNWKKKIGLEKPEVLSEIKWSSCQSQTHVVCAIYTVNFSFNIFHFVGEVVLVWSKKYIGWFPGVVKRKKRSAPYGKHKYVVKYLGWPKVGRLVRRKTLRKFVVGDKHFRRKHLFEPVRVVFRQETPKECDNNPDYTYCVDGPCRYCRLFFSDLKAHQRRCKEWSSREYDDSLKGSESIHSKF